MFAKSKKHFVFLTVLKGWVSCFNRGLISLLQFFIPYKNYGYDYSLKDEDSDKNARLRSSFFCNNPCWYWILYSV